MAKVMISDVIVPSIFLPYTQEKTAELSEFWTSGIVDTNETFRNLANGEGVLVQMPFWQDLSGEEEILDDTTELTPNKIETEQDNAGLHNVGKMWSANDLAGMLAGSDPMKAIGARVADYWARTLQARLIKTVTGVFAAASMSGSLNSIYAASGSFTTANYLTGETFIDTKGKLGDAEQKLVAIAMHSDVERSLRKQALIDDIASADLRMSVSQFQGLRVIVDDGMPKASANGRDYYDTYLFGTGAIAYGEATRPMPIDGGFGDWYVEVGRNHRGGDTDLVNRKRLIMHPRGVKYTGLTQAKGTGATRAELATANNWTRVFEQKNIRMVMVRHNLAP